MEIIFPIPLGEAMSWNLTLIECSAWITAVEASTLGANWTFFYMVDIARDAHGVALLKEQVKIPIWTC